MWLSYYFNFDVSKSKSPCILLNNNFNKNETESKMKNATQRFRATNLVLQLIQESQVKRKTVMTWSSRKKEEDIFLPFILSEESFRNICVLCFMYSVLYSVHTFRIYILFTYQKTLHALFCLFLKSSKALSVSLSNSCTEKRPL